MSIKVVDLTTDAGLLEALKSAKTKPSANEALEQRVSFVYGAMKSTNALTKEQVKQALLNQESA